MARQVPDSSRFAGCRMGEGEGTGSYRGSQRAQGDGGHESSNSRVSAVALAKAEIIESTRVLGLEEFATCNPVATSTVLVKKCVLADVGGFDEQFRGPEDYDLWMRIASDHTILKTSASRCRYRQYSGSLSMDDRTFLPEVLAVLDKAFAPNGALSRLTEFRQTAISTQFWNASWMAFHRGARGTAVKYWFRALSTHLRSGKKIRRPWLGLLWRYMTARSR